MVIASRTARLPFSVMNASSDSQSAPQTPEQFAEFLRMRVQEALAASVHHASLSQQYLSLSQRFSALAEQAVAGNALQALQSFPQLEREACSGVPAAPIPAMQSTATSMHAASAAAIPASDTGQNLPFGFSETPDSTSSAQPFYSPPARFTSTENGAVAAKDFSIPDTTPNPVTAPSAAETAEKLPQAESRFLRQKKFKRPVVVRSVLERARLAGLETAEKVRVKAKKSDLKPQLRTTTEELTLELKRGRTPAVISFVLTGIVLFILALRQMEFFEDVPVLPIISTISETITATEESLPIEPPSQSTDEQSEPPVEEVVEEPEPVVKPEPVVEPTPTPEPMPDADMPDAALIETPDGTAPSSPEPTDSSEQGATDNRSEAGRKFMLKKYGGSAASESAVGSALEWLAARQRVNGTWDFTDVGPCTQKGSVNNPIGGTAYALLPFLAAGNTHKAGQYKKQVQAGLAFLTSIGIVAPAGYDLRGVINKVDDDTDPNYAYYVHGAATLALCEAYAMTKDRKLKPAAEGAVSFLLNSQNPRGGGWRYNPQEGGSTSATAIQVMALKTAEKSGIIVPAATWKGVSYFLDSVSVDGEGRYGYEAEKKTYAISVTSMALLSRMYLGWGRDDGDMRAGIALIDRSTSTENYYTNYFATQVMKNWGGPEWDRWNIRVRDNLIARQETNGPGKGSWAPPDRADYSKSGGRLLTTCLATLTLQVYYRNTPLLEENQRTTSLDNPAAVVPTTSP